MSSTPIDPNAKLTRQATADALTAAGYPLTKKALDTMATRGGGPFYRLFGRKPLYRWGDALQWAENRMSKPIRTTREAKAA